MPDLESVKFFDEPAIRSSLVYESGMLARNETLVTISDAAICEMQQQVRVEEMSFPAGYVADVEDAYLSGHACLWKNEKFVSMNSYVSHVAEIETRGGAWQTPWTHRPTRTIKDRVAVGFSAGYGCFGHWLVDDIPRLGLLKRELGAEFDGLKIILTEKTPAYAKTMLQHILGIEEDRIVYFDHEREMLHLEAVAISSYQHENYNFNPYLRDFYCAVKAPHPQGRRICLSRRAWEKTKPQARRFLERRIFEDMAREAGFEMIAPETLSFAEQIECVSGASVIIAEHGSAQHMSLFAPEGCVIGTINPLTPVQVNIGRLYSNPTVLLIPDESVEKGPGSIDYSCSKKSLEAFFEHVLGGSTKPDARIYRDHGFVIGGLG